MDLGFLTNQQVRALAHSAPALQLDDLTRVFDSTSLALLEDLFQLDVPRTVRLVIFTTDLHGVVTLREYVETAAPLPTVDVLVVIVVATSVTRQYPHKASKSSSRQKQRKKLRRHELKGLSLIHI